MKHDALDLEHDYPLQVGLTVAELVALERGELPDSLRASVTAGLDQLTRGVYGAKWAEAVKLARGQLPLQETA